MDNADHMQTCGSQVIHTVNGGSYTTEFVGKGRRMIVKMKVTYPRVEFQLSAKPFEAWRFWPKRSKVIGSSSPVWAGSFFCWPLSKGPKCPAAHYDLSLSTTFTCHLLTHTRKLFLKWWLKTMATPICCLGWENPPRLPPTPRVTPIICHNISKQMAQFSAWGYNSITTP